MNGTRLQNSQRNWRNDPDIISMETRILPKNTPPATAPSAPRAMRLFPQVQIPVRNQTQSSATPECSTPTIHLSRKRPQSSDSSVNPTPSKRHRVVILEGSPIPKREPDQASDDTSPATNTTTVAGNDVDKDFADDARVETSARDKSNLSYAHNLGLEMVFFRFGDQILPSSIHRKVLRDAIPGFDTELKLLQPGENELMFGEDMQETVELLIEWCYKSTLPKVSDTTTPRDVFLRIKLWCVAARYGQVDLMNNTMDFLMRYLRDNLPRWDVEWATYAYNNTSPGSPLRNLVSKWFVNKFFSTPNKGRWTTEVFSSAAYGHPELLHDVMVHIRSLTDVQFANPKKDAPDMYHVEAAEPVEPEAPVEPVRSISAESPTEVRVATPMESTPEESDSEVYDVKEDGDPDFDEEPDENSDDDDFPLTRPGRRSTRAAKRSFPAPN